MVDAAREPAGPAPQSWSTCWCWTDLAAGADQQVRGLGGSTCAAWTLSDRPLPAYPPAPAAAFAAAAAELGGYGPRCSRPARSLKTRKNRVRLRGWSRWSGGIDSAVVAALAVDALGRTPVDAVSCRRTTRRALQGGRGAAGRADRPALQRAADLEHGAGLVEQLGLTGLAEETCRPAAVRGADALSIAGHLVWPPGTRA